MTQTAMKMAELKENERHNRQQELIGTANVISNAAGSLASLYTKRIPAAIRESREAANEGFKEQGRYAQRKFPRRGK